MKNLAMAAALALALAATAQTGNAESYKADNSGKNVRDRGDATLTPENQSGSEADVNITREIRKSIVADDNLSINAHNVKIITANGAVTLRGPVETAEEKARVAEKAKQVTGVTSVDNQLEIASH
jgi:osmotically-inducible protein OsmY